MTENDFPEKLLYYSKIDKRCIDVILKNTFQITNPIKGFNDPFDCFFELDCADLQKTDLINHLLDIFIKEKGQTKNEEDKYHDELKSCTEEILRQRLSECAEDIIKNHIQPILSKRIRIRSFSAQTADKTLNNIMFSHYGDSHKGVCYIFDTKKLIAKSTDLKIVEVDYSQKPVSLRLNAQRDYSDEELRLLASNMAKTKYEGWKYENEWRITKYLENPSENIHEMWQFEPDALEGIVLGTKNTKGDEERIKKLVEQRSTKVNIYKAKRRHGSFYLDYVKASKEG